MTNRRALITSGRVSLVQVYEGDNEEHPGNVLGYVVVGPDVESTLLSSIGEGIKRFNQLRQSESTHFGRASD